LWGEEEFANIRGKKLKGETEKGWGKKLKKEFTNIRRGKILKGETEKGKGETEKGRGQKIYKKLKTLF
jgi:hypothetical protein